MMSSNRLTIKIKRSNGGRLITATLAIALSALLLAVTPLLPAAAATTFGSPVQITHAAAQQRNVEMALDPDGNAHLTWWGYDTGGTAQIWYADNVSGSWSSPVKVTNAPSGQGQTLPQIAVDLSGKSHITWQGYDGTASQTYYTDNVPGNWTGNLVKLTSATNSQSGQQIVLDSNGNSHLTWSGYGGTIQGVTQIWYADNVSGWSVSQVTEAPLGNHQDQPQIAVDSGVISHIVWRAYIDDGTHRTHQIYYSDNFTESGSFAPPTQISNGPLDTDQESPQIVCDTRGNSHVTWDGWDAGTSSPRHIWYADNRDGWLRDLVTTTGEQVSPQIAVDADRNSYLTWSGWDGSTNQIFYADNLTGDWTDNVAQLSHATGGNNQYNPQISLDGNGKSHITWQGFNGAALTMGKVSAGVYQIYYADNTAGSWPGSPTQITQAAGDQTNPRIEVDSKGGPQIAWEGTSSNTLTQGIPVGGTYQIWFCGKALKPIVDKVDPPSGQEGQAVTVTGSNFGGTQGSSTVTIDGLTAEVVSWSDTRIVIKVPPGASSGAVVVTTGQGGSNTNRTFTLVYPTWYLAEGTTAWGFSTYITIENPNPAAVTAKITYMDPTPASGKGRVFPPRTITLPAMSQTTVDPRWDLGDTDFSTRVDCLQGKTIAVDRTMFWTGTGAPSPEGHNSVGTSSPAKVWYLPEGSSAWNFETWTLVENPNATDAHVTLTYMVQGGGPRVLEKTIPAYCRATYNMAQDLGAQVDASVKVTGDLPVIAEQSMYRNNRREGSCSIGANTPAKDYFLAEGTTAWGFTSYILVQNPNAAPADVTITCMTPDGPVALPTFRMDPNSRETTLVNHWLPDTDFSVQVHGTLPIIAERSMYWGEGTALGEACHASVGLEGPHMTFLLPDGQTSYGYETFTCVQNPNPGAVRVQVSYLPEGGGKTVSFTDEIPKGSRRTYNMSDKVPTGRASVMVKSLDGARPIMVERSIYWNGRGAGTNTVGVYSD
jgi:hypothetical protein